ncbi:glycosyltransferase family protein [Rhodospirillaceae bacterium SYSU D60014]|uniref:CgeB family protein n=1 Tax=Virgifigura deserti TaxID=2268457 RepID=UPI000E671444
MEIAFFGSSLLSAYWNGAATYYRGVIRALHALGHRTTFYEPDAFDRQKHRDLDPPDWARVVVYQATEAAAARALDAARGADVIVKASGVGVLDEWLEAAVAAAKRPDNLVLFWDVDAPATLERMSVNPKDPFRALVPDYDLVLTYGGGDPVVAGYAALGARACVPIYNALDPTTHFPAPPDDRFAGDLGFLGNRLPDREARVESFFIRTAERLPNRRFVLGGNGWHDKPLPSNVRVLGHVYTGDHNAFNASSLAILNIHRESMVRNGYSPATRLFEAAGAGACQITDRWEGIELFLEPEVEVLVASDADEVAQHLERLSPERARRIGVAAQRRILAEHTYAHRARQVESILDGQGGSHRVGAAGLSGRRASA